MSLEVVGIGDPAAPGLGAERLGAKGAGLGSMAALGLPVPPGFVVTTAVGRSFLRDRLLRDETRGAIREAVSQLQQATGRRLGDRSAPLLVSVRSGAAVSMPGMMSTVIDVGAPDVLGGDGDDDRFWLDTRRRFLRSFATTVLGLDGRPFTRLEARCSSTMADEHERLAAVVRGFEALVVASGRSVPADPVEQLELAVTAVLGSWLTPRAGAYRRLHGIPDDLGTAVTVQTMVFGNRDDRSATGVAFSRDPTTGEAQPYGDVLFTAQGEDVVSGDVPTGRLAELSERLPTVWIELLAVLAALERRERDMCMVEFTVESGVLWLLQLRRGGRTDKAAIRIAVELVDEQAITTAEALRRVQPRQVEGSSSSAADPVAQSRQPITTGLGASPGIATGRVATTAADAVRLAAHGAVLLVRPTTSPVDLHGIAAADGILTSAGGLASHAAVVARSLGKPAVVGAADVVVDELGGTVAVAGVELPAGEPLSIDGTSGAVYRGTVERSVQGAGPHLERLLHWADDVTGGSPEGRSDAERLAAAKAALANR